MRLIDVEVVGPDRVWWTGQATQVSAQTVEGSIGLLAGHEPILSVLTEGEVRVLNQGGESHAFQVAGGFVSFDHDTVRIVADKVTHSSE